jgi:hypothetical protein
MRLVDGCRRVPHVLAAIGPGGADDLARTNRREDWPQVKVELLEQNLRLGRLLAVIEQKGMNDVIELPHDRANERYLALTAELSGPRGAQARRQPRPLAPKDVVRYAGEMCAALTAGRIPERQALLRQFVRCV